MRFNWGGGILKIQKKFWTWENGYPPPLIEPPLIETLGGPVLPRYVSIRGGHGMQGRRTV